MGRKLMGGTEPIDPGSGLGSHSGRTDPASPPAPAPAPTNRPAPSPFFASVRSGGLPRLTLRVALALLPPNLHSLDDATDQL